MINDIVGKTIIGVKKYGIQNCDDEPAIELLFSDNTSCFISATYGGYTGKSADEYPVFIEFLNTIQGYNMGTLVEIENDL